MTRANDFITLSDAKSAKNRRRRRGWRGTFDLFIMTAAAMTLVLAAAASDGAPSLAGSETCPSFAAPAIYHVIGSRSVADGDLDSDGYADLVFGGFSDVQVLFNAGNGWRWRTWTRTQTAISRSSTGWATTFRCF